MSYGFYKVVHLLGIAMLLVSLGGLAFHGMSGGTRETNQNRKPIAIMHGIGMVIVLVAGFGLLAKRPGGMSMPPWVHPKLLIWLLFGAAMAFLGRKPEAGKWMWWVLPLLVATAAFFAVMHPFET